MSSLVYVCLSRFSLPVRLHPGNPCGLQSAELWTLQKADMNQSSLCDCSVSPAGSANQMLLINAPLPSLGLSFQPSWSSMTTVLMSASSSYRRGYEFIVPPNRHFKC